MEQNSELSLGSDIDIIRLILEGETPLFELLIRRNNTALYRIAKSFGFNHQDSQDIMQDVHVAAYLNLAKFRGESTYKTWISRMMANKCMYKLNYGYHKYEHPTEQVPEPQQIILEHMKEIQPDTLTDNRELAVILEKSLQNIPVIYRTVFVLRETEGFSTEETAQLLNITPVNVKVRLNRAKALLQKEIQGFYQHADIYSFNLVYCTALVEKIFADIKKLEEQGESPIS